MLEWFGRSRQVEQGWVALSLNPGLLELAQGRFVPSGTPVIARYASRSFDPGPGATEGVGREFQLSRTRCSALLSPGEYQLLFVEAPTVPAEELKSALRWRIKDMIDYHVDDATIDVLDVPPEEGAPARNHWMFAVAARNDVIQGRIREYEDAKIPLQVIDIPETAQRNIAALFESPGRGLALLHLGGESALLTITFKGELYLARRIEIGRDQFADATAEARESIFTRALVELQRTFDHFERQFRFVSVTELLLGPEPNPSGLLEYLAANLGMSVGRIDLTEKIRFEAGTAPDASEQARLFYLIGAALRHEGKVL